MTPSVGLVIGVVGILLAILGLSRARRYESKTLDWTLRTNEPILGVGVEYLRSDLSVTWNGERLENPRLVTLTIFNSGHREIAAADYTKPVSICVPDVARVVAALITGAPGNELDPKEHELEKLDCGNEVRLRPKLLNRGESIDIHLVVDGGHGRPEISARFSGQSRPPRSVRTHADASEQRRVFILNWTLGVLVIALTIVLAGLLLLRDGPPSPQRITTFFALVLALTSVAGIAMTLRRS